jgi:hypothetical protein
LAYLPWPFEAAARHLGDRELGVNGMVKRVACGSRRVAAVSSLTAVAFLVLLFPTLPASAQSGTATDPDDVSLRLDLKTISHDDDASSIIYTVETYEDFPDKWADFRWSLDKNGDQKVDDFVSVQWEDSDATLVASVDDADENPIAKGTVSRPAPNALRVSFPISVVKGVTSYFYFVSAATDTNQNGERDPGEEDRAPDTGWYQHRLGASPASTASDAPLGAPAAAPEIRDFEALAAPAPMNQAAVVVQPKRLPSGAHPMASRVAAAAAPSPTMPLTGPGDSWLALIGAGLICLAVPCRSLARKCAEQTAVQEGS